MSGLSRRECLGVLGGIGTTSVAGCSSSSSGTPEADVIVGPDSRLVFEPDELTVPVGDVVSWYFESPGHNVSCRPGDSDPIALPDGAEPFATYGSSESPRSLVAQGERFDHQFRVPGTYVYVCVPHVPDGMIGRITVES